MRNYSNKFEIVPKIDQLSHRDTIQYRLALLATFHLPKFAFQRLYRFYRFDFVDKLQKNYSNITR